MKQSTNFLKLKAKMTNKQFYKYCTSIFLAKENYPKIFIQKAQQFLDDYTKQKK